MSLVLIPVKVIARRADGTSVTGATVRAVLTVAETDDGLVVPGNITGVTDVNGEATLNLWPNARGINGSQYRVEIVAAGLFFSGLITIPEAPSTAWPVQLETLINQPPYPSRSVAEVAQARSQEYMLQAKGYRDESVPAAQTATTQAGIAVAKAAIATAAQVAAEAARDASFALGPKYATEAAGRAAVADGATFLVVGAGDVAAYEYRRVNSGSSTLIASYPSATVVSAINVRTSTLENSKETPGYLYAIADPSGYAALAVREDGGVEIPDARTVNLTATKVTMASGDSIEGSNTPEFVWAIADPAGNVALGVRLDGTVEAQQVNIPALATDWKTLALGTDDTIVHIGDSYTAAHYCLKDKAYISFLAALSPYRHINYGVSGNDALDMQYRIVNGATSTGKKFEDMAPRFAFISTLTNDSQFLGADITYYAENVRRLIETVRAVGTEPIVTTEFPAEDVHNAQLRRIADEYGIGFIDLTTLDNEMGALQLGPFHQGHPGTRNCTVFWLPMLAYIDRVLPKPDRAIKIFRRRSTFAVSAAADLLYGDRIDRNLKWKELTLFHFTLNPANKFEELSQLGTFSHDAQTDEYQTLRDGGNVPVADYALIEVTLPGTAITLDAVEITLATSAAATVYVRDFLDVAASMPGRAQGMTPVHATYLSKWNKPRGSWRSLGVYAAPITIAQAALKNSMQGDKLVIMVAGAFNLTGLQIRYKGRAGKADTRDRTRPAIMGAELLAQQLCGTSGQLAAWTTAGAPTTLVPIDLYNAPRKPGTTTPVDGVCTISATDTIGQTVTLGANTGERRRFRVTAWARYFPKAWLDPSLYPGIDAAQIIDRTAFPAGQTITTDTADLRTLKMEVWSGSYPAQGGAEFFDFAPLYWRPIEFHVDLPAWAITTASFRLSCPDGAIQVAKVSWKEVTP